MLTQGNESARSELWRFVFVLQEVAKLAQTAIDYTPMQPGESFHLSAVKAKVAKAMAHRAGT